MDYIFSGATTTARWLFSFKFWIVVFEMPKLFIENPEIKNRATIYFRTNMIAVSLINIPWLIVAFQEKAKKNFII